MRDYLASLAMQAIISKLPYQDNTKDLDFNEEDFEAVARGAYLYADAMLSIEGE